MQIKALHKSFYRIYSLSKQDEFLSLFKKKYEPFVFKWEKLKSEKVSDRTCKEIVGISRATYFRYKNVLKNLYKGILPSSKRPIKVNKPKYGDFEKNIIRNIRLENATYGKSKTTVILKRDYKIQLSESTVERVLKKLNFPKSISSIRQKRKRNFKNHAKPWTFKDYKEMQMGERVQIDHMSVSKNGITFKHFQALKFKNG